MHSLNSAPATNRRPLLLAVAGIAALLATIALVILSAKGQLPNSFHRTPAILTPVSATAPDMDSYSGVYESGIAYDCLAQEQDVTTGQWKCVSWHGYGTITATGEKMDMYFDDRSGQVTDHVG